MNIEDYYIGQKASISKVFYQEDVAVFSELSLDKNPVHLDEQYAANSRFGRRILHGFLSGSLISAVIGNILPGVGSIYLHQDMDFRKPAYTGERLTATVTITQIRMDKRILYLDTICCNDNNEVLIEGKAVVKI